MVSGWTIPGLVFRVVGPNTLAERQTYVNGRLPIKFTTNILPQPESAKRPLCEPFAAFCCCQLTHYEFHSSAAINKTELQSDEGANVVTYYFCSFTNAASQDPVNLIGSLLVQLCNIDATLWTSVDARYSKEPTKSNGNCAPLSLGEVTSMLGDALRRFSKVYIIVDAINESKQFALMFSTLWDLGQGHDGLRILFSSTEELLVPALQRTSGLLNTVSMTSALVDDDIRLYVESCLACNDRLRRLPISLKDDIRSKLLSRADGM